MADAEESATKITICVKTPKEKKDIKLTEDATIKELREEAAKAFSAAVEQLCIIFAGKILKDPDTLKQHGITDGLTVHLVIKSGNRSQEQATQRTPQTQETNIGATPFGLGSVGGLAGMSGLGMGSTNFMEMQQRMQRELMGNPEMLRQLMDNPMVQQMMSNPDVMRQLITNNPQMRELMERNPEITHMLNNPELMRQTMELARNPAMLQELMRTQDRAMSNLESIPGGFNALQRMYRDIQEPMMNAATEGFRSNPFSSLVSEGDNSENMQQGRENTEPLPNPWNPSSGSTTSTTSGTTTAPSTGGVFNTPGMQSLMQQMTQNPQLMQNMLQAPYMQNMMQSLSANPQLAQQLIAGSPMFSGNPQLQEQMRQALPTMMQQMQNPEVQSMMTNPRAMDAIMRIQQGMEQLRTEAPGLVGSMGIPGMSMPPVSPAIGTTTGTTTTTATDTATTTTSSDTTTTTSSTSDTNTATTTAGTEGSTTTTPSAGGQQQSEALSNFMSQMIQMMASGQTNQPPEQRYASQLDQLAGMGFVDRQDNLQALIATLGDVNAAIDRLLQRQPR